MKLVGNHYVRSAAIGLVVLLLTAAAADAVRVNICIRSGNHQVEFGSAWLTTGYGEMIPGSEVDFSVYGQFGPGWTKTLTTGNLAINYPDDITDMHVEAYKVDGIDYPMYTVWPPISPGVWYPLPPDDRGFFRDETLGIMFEDATPVEPDSWGKIKALYI